MIETLLTTIGIGTVWFWIITSLASIIFIASIENDHYVTPSILAIILTLIYWTPIMALGWKVIGIGIGLYILVGMIWSTFRWFRYVRAKVEYYQKMYGTVVDKSRMDSIKDALDVSYNKARIIGWGAYWPWSMLWNILGDLVNTVYDWMKGIYQRIADKALGNFKLEERKAGKNVQFD
jgi:hypothetical protein